MKYKPGDRVRIKNDDETRISDLEADLIGSLRDGTVKGAGYDTIMDAITTGKVWVITEVARDGYGLRVEGTMVDGCWMLEDDDLELVSPVSGK